MNYKEFLKPNLGKIIFIVIIFLSLIGFFQTMTIPPSKWNIYFSYVILPCIFFIKFFPTVNEFWIIPASIILWYLISCIVFSVYKKLGGKKRK